MLRVLVVDSSRERAADVCAALALLCALEADSQLIRRAVNAGVSSYIVDSVAPERLDALVEVAIAQFEAFQHLRAERDDATRRLSERITIDRAKGLLMKARGLDEGEAYHALRKLAMERGRKLADVAQDAGFATGWSVSVPKRCVLHCISAPFGVCLPTS